MHAFVQFMDVFLTMCVSHPIQNVTGGCLSSKEDLDTLSKGRENSIHLGAASVYIFVSVSFALLKDGAWGVVENIQSFNPHVLVCFFEMLTEV